MTIADTITRAYPYLRRLDTENVRVHIDPGSVTIQVTAPLPGDDVALAVADAAIESMESSPFGGRFPLDWTQTVREYGRPVLGSGYVEWTATRDGVEWTVWTPLNDIASVGVRA